MPPAKPQGARSYPREARAFETQPGPQHRETKTPCLGARGEMNLWDTQITISGGEDQKPLDNEGNIFSVAFDLHQWRIDDPQHSLPPCGQPGLWHAPSSAKEYGERMRNNYMIEKL